MRADSTREGRRSRDDTRRGHDLGWRDVGLVALVLIPVAVVLGRSRQVAEGCATLMTPFDARLVEYFLEWSHRFLQGAAPHGTSIWSPPFFYPTEKVLAYSDNLFSGLLTYVPLRWSGLDPSRALFAFQVLHWALTPVVTYLCLRAMRLGRWPSAIGAAVYSWGWVRYYHIPHLQFVAGYPIPLFFTALHFAYGRRRPRALVLAAATFVYAFYFSLYTAVFLALGTLALTAAHLALPGGTREASRALRSYCRFVGQRPRESIAILLLLLVSISLLAPGVLVYREVQSAFGPAPEAEVRTYWGDILSWVRPPWQHPLLGALYDDFPRTPTGGVWEQLVFVGWLGAAALAAPLLTLMASRRRAFGRWPRHVLAAAGAGLALMLVFSSWGGHWPEAPFWFLHRHLPGVGGLRAPSRIAFVVAWFVALSAALLLDRLPRLGAVPRLLASTTLGLLLLAENVAPVPRVADRCSAERVWDRTVEALCPQIDTSAIGTLLFLPAGYHDVGRIAQHTLAMRASLSCGLATVNGYSGRAPDRIQPLLFTPPGDFPCPAVRDLLDRVHEASGKGVLIHVDLGPPLAYEGFPLASVEACVAPCEAAGLPTPSPLSERPARILLTDPARRCSVDAP